MLVSINFLCVGDSSIKKIDIGRDWYMYKLNQKYIRTKKIEQQTDKKINDQ